MAMDLFLLRRSILSSITVDKTFTRLDFGWFMVFNATFSKISVISCRLILLVEETGVPPTCRKSLTKDLTMSNMVGVL
jgi:hypothetical protein